MPRVCFTNREGEQRELRLARLGSPYTLGSADDCDVVVYGKDVNEQHAVIWVDSKRWYLERSAAEGLAAVVETQNVPMLVGG